MADESFSVQHDSSNKQFVINFKDGRQALLHYHRDPKETTLDMYETVVPTEYRGKGIAAQLVKTAFNYAEENNLKVKPTCSYIQDFLSKNQIPKYLKLVLRK